MTEIKPERKIGSFIIVGNCASPEAKGQKSPTTICENMPLLWFFPNQNNPRACKENIIEIINDNIGIGSPLFTGSPDAKSSKVCGMVKKINRSERNTILPLPFVVSSTLR